MAGVKHVNVVDSKTDVMGFNCFLSENNTIDVSLQIINIRIFLL